MTIDELNRLPAGEAASAFKRCCGADRWVRAMTAARPFLDARTMDVTAETIWQALDRNDWLEAFAAHPRIGERAAGWAAAEQQSMDSAAEGTRQRLIDGNRAYETRFGYTFIISASGKSPEEMAAALDARLKNGPDEELRVAADEQRRITRLRLAKLVDQT